MNNKYVFYIDSMQKGGANRVMANLTDYFASAGKTVILINDIKPQKGVDEYTINESVKRIFLDIDVSSKLFSNILRIIALRKIIKNEASDVVVSFMGPPNIRMLIATIGLKCKRIVSVRNDPNVEYGKGLVSRFKRLLFMLADGCVFQTRDAATYFPKSVQAKSRVIFNPVNECFFNTERSNAPRNIVTVGRFEPQKNHSLLIRAFSKIANEFPEEKLILYGEGTLRGELKNLIEELNLTDRVLMPGSIANVWEKLAEAKIFVLSSDFEGMPNALMEAMAVGVPVISTDCPCGGPRSLIEDSTQGLLIPIGNEVEMAKAMDKLLSDVDLRKTISEKTKQRAKCFLPKKVYLEWKDYLEKI